MSRRRMLTVYTSSDEEDERQQPPTNPNPYPNPNEVSEQPIHEYYENDNEIEDPIPNLQSVTLNPIPTITAETNFMASDCPVNDWLRKMGLRLKREWLDSCKLGLQTTVPGFGSFDVETKAKLCFGQVLFSDMNFIGSGVLPENVHQLHLVDLAGPFVLQVDEVINITCPLKERYKSAPAGLKRCLKLSMTDGVQRVCGMEYRPIPNKILGALGPAGFKVVIRNVHVRRGLLMLVPEVLEVLGGSVEELESARERLINEINKPPRGRRSRTGVAPPLSVRATAAAWPQNGVSDDPGLANGANHIRRNTTNAAVPASTQVNENAQVTGRDTMGRTTRAYPVGRETAELLMTGHTNPNFTSRVSSQQSTSVGTAHRSANTETAVLPPGRVATELPPRRESTWINSFSTTFVENEDAGIVDHVEHPFILSEKRESPFTYLASLSTKWAAVQGKEPFVQGKIKCFLTGVKGFQYKQRSTFDLRVYVDDGSLISEILIHHDVVQKAIGYSPEEVTGALSSSDQNVAAEMKATLKQFQIFLINFEGTMTVQMKETSTVALEMEQGCSVSDAWLLLQRLKPAETIRVGQIAQSDLIELSP